jgi:tetratricopeptide (TPR) repeat protein
MLDRLEKNALGVESYLSILKRRRNLTRIVASEYQSRFQNAYRDAAERASAAFPFSEPLAAIAAEARILSYPAGTPNFTGEDQADLRRYAGFLSASSHLIPLALDISVLLGDFSDPGEAALMTGGAELLNNGISSFSGPEREGFLINSIIQRLLRDERDAAQSQIVTLLGGEGNNGGYITGVSEIAQRFGAEYFYDTGNFMRAAEIFSRFSDPPSLGSLADTLWFAGFHDGAVEIWTVLAASSATVETSAGSPAISPAANLPARIPGDLKIRSLYNLASVAGDTNQKIAYFEKLFAEAPGHVYGVIGYSRLFDSERAEDIITELYPRQQEPLADLELLRRRLDGWETRRTVAETWLLLGRHPQEAALYQWGTWYFDRQRQYPETALLLRQARLNNIDGPWLALHDSLRLIRENRLEEGAAILEEQAQDNGVWQIPANLGLILESRRSPSTAMNYYETAASLVKEPLDAAKVQLRIARCLRILGRTQESRQALEQALNLDPDNLNARLELRRLEQ